MLTKDDPLLRALGGAERSACFRVGTGTPRNLFGQVDGTVNPTADPAANPDAAAPASTTSCKQRQRQRWLPAGVGTRRHLRGDSAHPHEPDTWDEVETIPACEDAIGRNLSNGHR